MRATKTCFLPTIQLIDNCSFTKWILSEAYSTGIDSFISLEDHFSKVWLAPCDSSVVRRKGWQLRWKKMTASGWRFPKKDLLEEMASMPVAYADKTTNSSRSNNNTNSNSKATPTAAITTTTTNKKTTTNWKASNTYLEESSRVANPLMLQWQGEQYESWIMARPYAYHLLPCTAMEEAERSTSSAISNLIFLPGPLVNWIVTYLTTQTSSPTNHWLTQFSSKTNTWNLQ